MAWVKRDYALGKNDYDAWSVAAPVAAAVRSAALTWVRNLDLEPAAILV